MGQCRYSAVAPNWGEFYEFTGAMVSQFIGVSIMAIFNLPAEDPEHAARALCAALDIIELTANQTFNGEHLAIRAGIATGPVIAGSVGGSGQHSYSLYGDPVNLGPPRGTQQRAWHPAPDRCGHRRATPRRASARDR